MRADVSAELAVLLFFGGIVPYLPAARIVPDLLPLVRQDVSERLIRQPALARNDIARRSDRHVAQARSA